MNYNVITGTKYNEVGYTNGSEKKSRSIHK